MNLCKKTAKAVVSAGRRRISSSSAAAASSSSSSAAAALSSVSHHPPSHVDLEELAQQYGTPYQLYDEAGIRQNARELISSFKKHFPTFQQHFAVKALPNPTILKILMEEGCGLDCSSHSELWIANALDCPASKICYTSNYTSNRDLLFAVQQGVLLNLDDLSLVDHLNQAIVQHNANLTKHQKSNNDHDNNNSNNNNNHNTNNNNNNKYYNNSNQGIDEQKMLQFPEIMSFRLNPGVGRTDSKTLSNVLAGPAAKFGVPQDQIVEAYARAQEYGSKRFGIHMMTGSCVMSSGYWEESLSRMFDIVARVRSELSIEFEFVNVGGGLGIPYEPGEERVNVDDLVSRMRTVFDRKLAEHQMPEPDLHMENGRYMTGPFGWLVSRCHVIKSAHGNTYYGLDSCMSNLMRPGMYGSYHHITVPKNEDSSHPRHCANVVGTLCENNDWFAKERDLPESKVDDLFVIHDTGAHSHSMGFNYNGTLRAPELLVRNDRELGQNGVSLIRERETIEGLFNNCHIPTDLLNG